MSIAPPVLVHSSNNSGQIISTLVSHNSHDTVQNLAMLPSDSDTCKKLAKCDHHSSDSRAQGTRVRSVRFPPAPAWLWLHWDRSMKANPAFLQAPSPDMQNATNSADTPPPPSCHTILQCPTTHDHSALSQCHHTDIITTDQNSLRGGYCAWSDQAQTLHYIFLGSHC